MGGPETLWISFYGTDLGGILLVQCTLNGTRCAVSLIGLDRLLCLQGASRQQWWAALPITARGVRMRFTVCDERLLDWDGKAKSNYPG